MLPYLYSVPWCWGKDYDIPKEEDEVVSKEEGSHDKESTWASREKDKEVQVILFFLNVLNYPIASSDLGDDLAMLK